MNEQSMFLSYRSKPCRNRNEYNRLESVITVDEFNTSDRFEANREEKTVSRNATSIIPLPHLEVLYSSMSPLIAVEYLEAKVLRCWRQVVFFYGGSFC